MKNSVKSYSFFTFCDINKVNNVKGDLTMKKKVIIVLIVAILLILLFPIRSQLRDGGTVEYKALLYKVSKVSRLISIEEMEAEGKVKDYDKGIIIEVFGFEIFNSVN